MDKKSKPSLIGEIIKKLTKKTIKEEAIKEKNKSYDIRKIFEQMELDLISSMHRAFYFHQSEEAKEGFKWEQWQLTKLREIEKYRKRNREIVGAYSDAIQKTIDRELRGNYSKGESRITRLVDKIKQILKPSVKVEFPVDISEHQATREYISMLTGRRSKPIVEDSFFGVNEKKLEALITTAKKDVQKAQYSALRKMDDVYRQTIFKSQVYMQSGTKTLNQAVDMATKDFLSKGIDSIEYKNGARVNIGSYAEMCLRTASQRATFLGEGKKRNEYGIHLVVVSAHANTCKMCEKWQGKILIDDVFSNGSKKDGEYPLLSQAITEGFLHPNCRHNLITYFPEVTSLPQVPNGEQAIKVYEAEQKQRKYEREIRKWKRIVAGSCDEESKKYALSMVKRYQKNISDLLKENPSLKRNYPKEEIRNGM